ncbi:MAG TPA: Uma2 family endonuclease [Isosphaeraceae bacterium]|nr:Uma2 family endonuclease [Isosphaeraceae bacterium]
MTAAVVSPPDLRTLADLLVQLGDISPARVLLRPRPGDATEEDLLELLKQKRGLYELVDGVLVEKGMGIRESLLAVALAGVLRAFVLPRNLGIVCGADGMLRLFPGLVRGPDVAFISWGRIPTRRVPTEPVPELAPDLAVEVLSDCNTPREMARKRREYFDAGVTLVWQVDPNARTVAVYTAPEQATVLNEAQTLDGGTVLPGFTLLLRDLFGELDRHGTP